MFFQIKQQFANGRLLIRSLRLSETEKGLKILVDENMLMPATYLAVWVR